MKNKKGSPKQIDKEVLAQLDDEQLKEIAGGAKYSRPDDEPSDETCFEGGITCGCTPTVIH